MTKVGAGLGRLFGCNMEIWNRDMMPAREIQYEYANKSEV